MRWTKKRGTAAKPGSFDSDIQPDRKVKRRTDVSVRLFTYRRREYLLGRFIRIRHGSDGFSCGWSGLASLHRKAGVFPGRSSTKQCVRIRDPFLVQFVYQTGT